MSEPCDDETPDLAVGILDRALSEMIAAGIGGVEACHAAAHMAFDMLPAFACRECLARHYGYMLEVLEDRIEGIPSIPDNEIAQACPEHLH